MAETISLPIGTSVSAEQSLGRASQACQRCYRRKKKCDRTLPRCHQCTRADARCSLLETNDETGVFPVAYVHRLQQRVEQLEQELKRYQSAFIDAAQAQRAVETSTDVNAAAASDDSLASVAADISPRDINHENLESGVGLISLEAVAERYLGSSSGVTFARFTQAVLKRLRPDFEPFSFHDSDPRGNASGTEDQACQSNDSLESEVTTVEPVLPAKEDAYRLTDFYWSHSHSLYPFLRREWFMTNLQRMYAEPTDPLLRSSPWLYTMWMVFAIGSTSLSSITLSDEEESIRYWRFAMVHFDKTLQGRNMTALSSLLLQVSYSFFNQVGPNTWYLVGMAIRIALGMGLHVATPASQHPPIHIREYKSRLFFSLYMMDRMVSITLGRPFGLRDEDVEIECFTVADDAEIFADKILPHPKLTVPLTAIPAHILSLRRLAGHIFQDVYSKRNVNVDQDAKDQIVLSLHQRLIEWRRGMPFPMPECRTLPVPQLSTAWYDLNYYNHVIMIYRPSPMCPIINVEKVTILAEAATAALRQIATMRANRCFSFNWLNLFSLFTTALALIYAVTAQPQPLSEYLTQSGVLEDLRLAADILHTYGSKFASARRYHVMVLEIISELERYLPHGIDSSDRQHSLGRGEARRPESLLSEASSYPAQNIENARYDQLQSRFQIPSTFPMTSSSGLFDEFAAHDLVDGFDMMIGSGGATDLQSGLSGDDTMLASFTNNEYDFN